MENYGSSPHYPYHNPYAYPPPPQPPPNHAYPPPPPHPYAYHAANYGYPPHYPPPPPPAAYSGPLDYHQPSSASPASSPSHSGHLDYHHQHHHHGGLPGPAGSYPYQYPAAPPSPSQQPSLQHHGSFQYGGGHYDYQQQPAPEAHSHAPSRAQSFSGGSYGGDASSGHAAATHDASSNYPSLYPPLDDLMSSMRISEGHSTTPASPPAPAVPNLGGPSPDSSFSNHANFYGYPNDSFSSSWEGSSGRYDGSPQPAYVHSSSFNGSQHSQSLEIVPLQHPKGSLKVLLLHGNLDIWVHEARNLPNMDMFHKTLGDVFSKLPGNVQNKIEGHMSSKVTSDPYVTISVSNAVIGRTYVLSNSENPVWWQHFNVPVAHCAAEVHFVVKDSDVVGSQQIGVVAIPVEHIYSGAKIENTYPILNSNGKPCKPGAVLSLSIQYIPIERLSTYHRGVGAGPDYQGVPGTYFPLRKGGTVTLYQDAHVPDGSLPNVKLDGGMYYAHGKCWQDIFDAIRQARKLIYITGWSVWHQVRLVRDAASGLGSTLGELLRTKSQEGVRVLLLVWDDPTSRNILGFTKESTLPLND